MNPHQPIVNVYRVVFATLLAASLAGVPAALAAEPNTTSRIVDYFRRKQNLPPDVGATIVGITDSKLPGMKQATIELSRGKKKQNVGILMSEDGRYVVFGELEDVTADPFIEIAKKISLDGQPSQGPKDAKVTIVEFSDFQCPYCGRAYKTMSEQVLKKYGDRIRLVYKNFPLSFHSWAERAAIAGECAFRQNEKAFWTLYDYFFTHQKDIKPANFKEQVATVLKDAKINKTKFDGCLDSKATQPEIRNDMAEGQAVGVTGTPAFIINGRKISGAQPFESFKAIIDDELARAEKKG